MSADPFHPLASGDTALFYRAAIGVRGQGYHLPRFLRFDEQGQPGLSWNWAASLFTFNWLVYRKMWGWALAYVGALGLSGVLVFGVGKLVFDYSGALAWMLGLWLLSAAFIVPGLYANVWLYGHYNDRISTVLRRSTGVTDAIGQLTAVAPGPRRLGRQMLLNALLLSALLTPVLAMQDWHGVGGTLRAAWASMTSPFAKAAAQEAAPLAAANPAATQTASGAVMQAASTPAASAPAPAPAAVTRVVAAAGQADDAAKQPVTAFEPIPPAPTRPVARAEPDLVSVASFAANPVAAAPLNTPLPSSFSAPRPATASPGQDLVPLEEMTLSSNRVKTPTTPAPAAKTAPRPNASVPAPVPVPMSRPQMVAQANTSGNTASGMVTTPVDSAPPRAAAAPVTPMPVAPSATTTPAARAPAADQHNKPQSAAQPSARLRAASQAAQAKRAAGPVQPGAAATTASASAAPRLTASQSAAQSSQTSGWVVQAGVFRQADNAHRVLAQLQALGMPAALENFPNSRGEPMLRVVAGPFDQQAQASVAAQRIQAQSLPAMVMRQPR